MTSSKAGQMFAIDLTLGIVLMTGTLLAVVLFIPEPEPPFTHDVERLQSLMTEGVPADWTAATVIIPGFLSDDRFNLTKINEFASVNNQTQLTLLGLESMFTIRFYNSTDELALCASCGAAPATYKQVLPVRRTALLNSEIVTMEVLLYR